MYVQTVHFCGEAFLSYNEDVIVYNPNHIFTNIRENEKDMLPNMLYVDYITGEEIDW